MEWFIVILGIIAGAIFWGAMLRASKTTAAATSATLAANQLMLDAMTPEQKARIAAAQEERLQAEIAERDRVQDRKFKLFLFLAAIVGITVFVAYLFPAAKPAATPAAVTSVAVSPPSDPPPEPGGPLPAQLDQRCAGGKCAPVGAEKGRPLRKQDLGGGVTVQ